MQGEGHPEEIVSCPYNSAHRLPKHRLNRHMVKCKIAMEPEQVQCPFNTTHSVPAHKLKSHVETCPNRRSMDEVIHRQAEFKDPLVPLPTQSADSYCEENWEDDNFPTYDPKEKSLGKPVLRQLNCASKAKRREFREEEKARIARLKDESIAAKKGSKNYDLEGAIPKSQRN